jgi:succinoglycan biosynthesis transport protein ExoP
LDASLLSSTPPTASQTPDVRAVLAVLLKRWPIVLVCFIASVGASFVYTSRQPRIYRASASIVIDPVTPNALGTQFREVVDPASAWWGGHEYLQTQHRVIQSQRLGYRVAQELKLQSDPRFVGKLAPGEKPPTLDQLGGMLAGMIEHTDPEIAALVVNGYAKTYEMYNLQERLGSTQSNTSFLSGQVDDLRKKLETTEKDLYEFRQTNGILSVSLEDRQNILSQEVQKLSDAATRAKTLRIELAAKRKQLVSLRDKDPLADATIGRDGEKSLASVLKGNYLSEVLKLRDLETKAGPQWPEVKQAKARLEKILSDLKREAGIMVRQVEAEYAAVQDTERNLQAALHKVTTDALELNKKELDYNRLKRDKETTQKLFDLVLGRLKESGIAQQLNTNNVRRLDDAEVPGYPVRPNARNNMALGLAIGLFGGLGLAFLLEFLDRTIKTQEDIERDIQVPFLGIIPVISQDGEKGPREKDAKPLPANRPKELYALDYPKSAVAECCRGIRTNLLFTAADRPLRALLVTSSSPKEGKSTTAVSLAVTIAQSGKRVLVVDTDLRRPRLHRVFGISSQTGISTVIAGEAKVEDIIRSTDVPNLWVAPCGPTPPNPAELLHSEKFKEIAREFGERFDQVIFDSPPMAAVTDAAVLSQLCDGVVLVAKSFKTTRDMMMRAKKQLTDIGGRILGAVLNDVDLSRRGGSYGGYYYYYRRYGQYYREETRATE